MTAFIIAPAFVLSFTANDNANFSGEWKLNESKSDMGQFANIVPTKIKVEQTADAFTTARSSSGFNGEDVLQTETLTFDGKEAETTVLGTSKRKASAKWSDDGQTIIVTYSLMLDFNGQVTEIKGTETWALADGGKSLSMQNTSSSSFGDNTFKGVYEK
ncbi:MAG: hypothetical protein JJE22_09550 [Bacteroidia bacterium]|nr:hypothetical protein [Bacteroidia bacterium]